MPDKHDASTHIDELRRLPRAARARGHARAGVARHACSTPTRRSRRSPSCAKGPFAFLLESAPAGGETWARYTFLGTAPRAAWQLRDGVVRGLDARSAAGTTRARPTDPLADLDALLRATHAGRGARARRVLERRGRLLRLRHRAADRAAAVAADEARAGARRAVRVHRRAGDHRQPAVAGARRRRRARSTTTRATRRCAARTTRAAPTVERTIARLRAPSDAAAARPAHRRASRRRDVSNYDARASSSPTSSGSASTSSPATRSRCSSRGASTCRTTSPSRGALSRAARAQSVAVHVPPRARRRGARRQLAGAARSRERGHGDGASDRRHAAARRDAGGGRGA